MIPLELADRIATEVLPTTLIKGAGGLPLIRSCPCEWGPCGRCQDLGRHDQCTTKAGWKNNPPPVPDAWLAGVEVWPSGTPCSWRCPCVCPKPELPDTVQLGLFDLAAPGPAGGLW